MAQRSREGCKEIKAVSIYIFKFFICPANAHNSYKIVKLLKSFKIIIVAPTCFGLHKPSSGSSQPVLRQSYSVDFGYMYHYLKLSVLWLHYVSHYKNCKCLNQRPFLPYKSRFVTILLYCVTTHLRHHTTYIIVHLIVLYQNRWCFDFLLFNVFIIK